jgi:hypothetical protein
MLHINAMIKSLLEHWAVPTAGTSLLPCNSFKELASSYSEAARRQTGRDANDDITGM